MLRPSSPSAKAPRSRSASPSSSLFVAAWAFATLGGYVSKTFLADPITMLRDGWELLTRFGFAYDIGMTDLARGRRLRHRRRSSPCRSAS